MSKHSVIATLYSPESLPQVLPAEMFPTLELVADDDNPVDKIAGVLGCPSEAVEILNRAPSYITFAVSNHQGRINRAAMQALAHLSIYSHRGFGAAEAVSGPVLILQQSATEKMTK